MTAVPHARTLVLACGALAGEITAIRKAYHLDHLELDCLPAKLHLRPELIADALRDRLRDRRGEFERVLIGYADCGTAGEIDDVCAEFDADRIDGAHCYQFFAGIERFDQIHASDPTIFWLTDFLARHFDLFVINALGIADHPELAELYFGNYTRLIYLAQTDDADLDLRAQAAAERLGLRYERMYTGFGDLEPALVGAVPVSIASPP